MACKNVFINTSVRRPFITKGRIGLEKVIRIMAPVDGDMLDEYDGIAVEEGLLTKVKILAPSDSRIRVNGIPARYSGEIFIADIPLKSYENRIEMVEENTGYRQSIKVFRLKKHTNRYRVSLDDTIWCLRDIAANADAYKSIFENPYLAFLKLVHDTYGTKIHINLYYQTDGFNLSQMPGKYKNEWKENAGWLRLSFHALQNDPDKPYRNSDYGEVKKDCEQVMEQIRRFAGEELMAPVTTLHWGEATVNGCRALRDSGYKVLAGYFNVDNDLPPVSYYLDAEQRRHLSKRTLWKDNREDLIFSRISIVLDRHALEEIPVYLDAMETGGHKPEYVDLLMHEQYFYPFYEAYQADYRQKILTAAGWAADHGYSPAFLSECVFE